MIYLDHHSTTPIDPRVLDAMMPYLKEDYGNPASTHEMGERAQEAVNKARESVAKVIHGAKPEEIYFTSSATEANNIAILGAFAGLDYENSMRIVETGYHRPMVLSSYIEHKSILSALDKLNHSSRCFVVPESDGIILPEKIEQIIQDIVRYSDMTPNKIDLVSIMAANNEIGTIQDLVGIRNLCNKYDIIFHTDAAQAAGKVRLTTLHADMITLSSHKIYGPKGIGALYIGNKVKNLVKPIIHGAYQEHITSGTLNVPAIVGFGKACDIIIEEWELENKWFSYLRDIFMNLLKENIPGLTINGTMNNRLSNNLNISIDGIDAEAILNIPDLCCSTGSACQNSGEFQPSHVIRAIGANKQSIRFGFGRFNTEQEVRTAAIKIIQAVKEIRNEV